MESEGIFWMKHLFATNVNGGVRDEVLIYFKSKLKNNKTKRRRIYLAKYYNWQWHWKSSIVGKNGPTNGRMDGRRTITNGNDDDDGDDNDIHTTNKQTPTSTPKFDGGDIDIICDVIFIGGRVLSMSNQEIVLFTWSGGKSLRLEFGCKHTGWLGLFCKNDQRHSIHIKIDSIFLA